MDRCAEALFGKAYFAAHKKRAIRGERDAMRDRGDFKWAADIYGDTFD